MDDLDRKLIDRLHGGFPLSKHPFAEVALDFGVDEETILERVKALLSKKVLTRFGPLYDAERLGGAFSLCAMSVPAHDFERVAALVNAHPEVAHNYEREHRYNMWFVLATTSKGDIDRVISSIESETGYAVMNLPREEEFFVELRLSA